MGIKHGKKILIIRLSAIGDVVMASPLIASLKRSWPESEVAWLVEEASEPVLRANQNLDEVIVWPRGWWRDLARRKRFWTLFKEAVSFIRNLREKGFDMAIDAQGLLKSGVWAYLSGAKKRIGIGSKEGSRLLMTSVVSRSGASEGLSSQYLLLAEAMGLQTEPFSMEVALSDEAVQFAQRFREDMDIPYVALSPFTTRPQKHWFEDRWIQTAIELIRETGRAIVILGGPGDAENARRLAESVGEKTFSLAGRTSIQEAAAVIRNSSLLIGVDTGLTHMGYALGVPTIALFGATRPYLDTGGLPGTVLYHPHECSPCRRSPTCEGDLTCMKAITTAEVMKAAQALLEIPRNGR